MKLLDCRLLADEDLHSQVVAHLRASGMDVLAVREEGWSGKPDTELLHIAVAEDRVVVTHDSDFGTLAIRCGEPVFGIVYLRPGHMRPAETIALVQTVLRQIVEVTPPFIMVAQRRDDDVTIRIRELTTEDDSAVQQICNAACSQECWEPFEKCLFIRGIAEPSVGQNSIHHRTFESAAFLA